MNIVQIKNGKVELRSSTGLLLRTIDKGNAKVARWNGADIAIATIKKKR